MDGQFITRFQDVFPYLFFFLHLGDLLVRFPSERDYVRFPSHGKLGEAGWKYAIERENGEFEGRSFGVFRY